MRIGLWLVLRIGFVYINIAFCWLHLESVASVTALIIQVVHWAHELGLGPTGCIHCIATKICNSNISATLFRLLVIYHW